MITEREYINIIGTEHRKKYAQFFTPEPIASFMIRWVMQGCGKNAHILEPAFGLGVFSRVLLQHHPKAIVTGYDIDKTIFDYAKTNFSETDNNLHLCNEDYMTASWEEQYDGIICNPPYLKFHDYDNARYVPLVNKHLHTKLSGFTNLYTLFLLKSIAQLAEGGRLAYIIPSEFLNADYGVEVKRALLKSRTLRHIIIVDFTQCPFIDALTTASILLCEKANSSDTVRFSTIENIGDLDVALHSFQTVAVSELDPSVKWKQYYEQSGHNHYRDLVPFSTFAKVSRGIATGANKYFTFNEEKKVYHNLSDQYFIPCIAHSTDVQSQIFMQSDFEALSRSGKDVYLFNGSTNGTDTHVMQYIQLGERIHVNKRYLTSNRSPWYALENRKPSPIWVSVFNRNGLRFVRNEANVYNLTTFHCVYNLGLIDTNILFAYLVTDLAKEIFLENSRQYGNGLIKFEPNDLNNGKVVDLRLLTVAECSFINEVYEQMHYFGSINERCTKLLDDFFKEKYTIGTVQLEDYEEALHNIIIKQMAVKPARVNAPHVQQLNFFDLIDIYANTPIVRNDLTKPEPDEEPLYDQSKNVLISLVKNDNKEAFVNGTAQIYYTGKRFPKTIELNQLYYFMPYIKNEGIRDLYLIKIVRIGTCKVRREANHRKDFRLVFEIEYLGKLFDKYKLLELNIWHTFTDTTMEKILRLR